MIAIKLITPVRAAGVLLTLLAPDFMADVTLAILACLS
jgi:hypothetical protein